MSRSVVLAIVIASLTFLIWLPTTSTGSSVTLVLPPRIALNLLAGETGSYQLRIHNGIGGQVLLNLSVVVFLVPEGGSASHILLRFPPSVVASTGNTLVTISVIVSSSAVPGTYVLINTITLW